MNSDIRYLNERDRHPEKEFLMEQYSGAPEDLHPRSREVLFNEGISKDDLNGGDWIVIVDGRLIDTPNEFCPGFIYIRD